MPTPIFICGGECGIAVVGTLSAGVEHWSASTNFSAVTSGPSPMRSTRCLRAQVSGGATASGTHTFTTAIASPATAVARFYVYFTTFPPDLSPIFRFNTTLGVYYRSTDGTLRGGSGPASGTIAGSGIAVTTGQWYRVDVKVVAGATRTVDLQVNGVAAAQFSEASSAATITQVQVGSLSGVLTCDMYYDDIYISGTSGDYPIGDGMVSALYPNADIPNSAANPTNGNGGHFYSATTDFGKGAGGAVALAAQNVESTAWQSLAKPIPSAVQTNFLADLTGDAPPSQEWLTFALESLPANAGPTQGLMVVVATHSAAATANNMYLDLYNTSGGLLANLFVATDLSETTITIPVVIFTSNLSVAQANALALRWYSGDVTPDVYLDGVCLEVAHTILPPSFSAVKARRR